MKIAITGSGGFIGSRLKRYFTDRGDEVTVISRKDLESGDKGRIVPFVDGVDVVINLAGATIDRRWTPSYKREIMNSRVKSTKLLVGAINAAAIKPKVFISASATGIYSPSKIIETESSRVGHNGFLSDVCRRWEDEALKIDPAVRVVIARLGVVFASEGGALPEILRSFRVGVAVQIGDGSQYMPWIHIDDVVAAVDFVLRNPSISGPCNFVAPDVPTNRRLTRMIAGILHTPVYMPVPSRLIGIMLGQRAELLTKGSHVVPAKLIEYGYEYKFPSLRRTLTEILKK